MIVGASLTGATAAVALREAGFDGSVTLVGAEAHPPYERPPLSKDYLRGEADGKPYVHDESFYAERQIELHTSTTVERIDAGAQQVALAGGETLRFDRLLLATGARPRRLSLPGAELDGVLSLRTVADKLVRRHPHVFQDNGQVHDAASKERAPSADAAVRTAASNDDMNDC